MLYLHTVVTFVEVRGGFQAAFSLEIWECHRTGLTALQLRYFKDRTFESFLKFLTAQSSGATIQVTSKFVSTLPAWISRRRLLARPSLLNLLVARGSVVKLPKHHHNHHSEN
jgi:hypothetical protein